MRTASSSPLCSGRGDLFALADAVEGAFDRRNRVEEMLDGPLDFERGTAGGFRARHFSGYRFLTICAQWGRGKPKSVVAARERGIESDGVMSDCECA